MNETPRARLQAQSDLLHSMWRAVEDRISRGLRPTCFRLDPSQAALLGIDSADPADIKRLVYGLPIRFRGR